MTAIVKMLYRLGLARAKVVFFQNKDDHQVLINSGLVHEEVTTCLPGSGVDLQHFSPLTDSEASFRKSKEGQFNFLLAGRLLWDKGVGEYVEAARRITARRSDVKFYLLGFVDVENPTAVSREQVLIWNREGIINYLESVDDIRPYLQKADCAVLPSYYREGVPRFLLEAASMAVPVITTDSVGCRDALNDGETGLLCEPGNVDDLVAKMESILALPVEQLKKMGRNGRKLMVEKFDEEIVIKKYLDAVDANTEEN